MMFIVNPAKIIIYARICIDSNTIGPLKMTSDTVVIIKKIKKIKHYNNYNNNNNKRHYSNKNKWIFDIQPFSCNAKVRRAGHALRQNADFRLEAYAGQFRLCKGTMQYNHLVNRIATVA